MYELYKNQDLYRLFHFINVNDNKIKLPRYVQSVPTLIVNESNLQRPQIKVGNDVFEWYKSKVEEGLSRCDVLKQKVEEKRMGLCRVFLV